METSARKAHSRRELLISWMASRGVLWSTVTWKDTRSFIDLAFHPHLEEAAAGLVFANPLLLGDDGLDVAVAVAGAFADTVTAVDAAESHL